MTEEIKNNEYKGFSLFNDIEDADLRNRNRAVIMRNIATARVKNRKITPSGASFITHYFEHVPSADKKDVLSRFLLAMQEEGLYVARA